MLKDMTRISRLVLAMALAACAGCSDRSDTGGPSSNRSAGKDQPYRVPQTTVESVAWLSGELPSSAVGYVRLPLLWDGMFEPQENALSNVRGSAEYQDQLNRIREGLETNLLALLPTAAQAPARLLLTQATSPLEMAILLPPDGSLVPNFLIGTTLDLKPEHPFANVLNDLMASSDQIRLLSPPDDSGMATVLAGPMPVYVQYQEDSGRLYLLTGTSATASFLSDAVAAGPTSSAVASFQQTHDAAGRGAALWLDIDGAWPRVSPMIPADTRRALELLGIDQIRNVHLASVARQGRGRLLLNLDLPDIPLMRLFPDPATAVTASTSGVPDLAIRLTIPSREQAEAAYDQMMTLRPGIQAQAEERDPPLLEEITDTLGFDPLLILDAYGPELLLVSDAAGVWGSYQVRDRAAHETLMAAITDLQESAPQPVDLDNQTYYRWRLKTPFLPEQEVEDPGMRLFLDVMGRFRTHLYWTEASDRLVTASVPQVLMARNQLGSNVELNEWLTESVGVNADHSLFLIAFKNRHGARGLYYFSLEALLMLADLAQVDINLFDLPTWQETAGLAPGGVALGLDATEQGLLAHLNYQVSPLEAISGGQNLFVVAAGLGIVAAVAVPAYQDYLARAHVAKVLTTAALAEAKLMVTESLASSGAMPGSLDTEALLDEFVASADYDPTTGEIFLELGDAPGNLSGQMLILRPETDETGIRWICATPDGMQNRFLPRSCQSYE